MVNIYFTIATIILMIIFIILFTKDGSNHEELMTWIGVTLSGVLAVFLFLSVIYG